MLRFVIPYTTPELTERALAAASDMARGLEAEILLLKIHIVPWPRPVNSPVVDIGVLESRLREAAGRVDAPVRAKVVLARDRESGLREALLPGCIVLLAVRPSWRRTAEEKLARELARGGHGVALVMA